MQKEIEEILEKIEYPILKKPITTLKLVDDILVKNDELKIVLNISNLDAFEKVKKQIKESSLKELFKSIEVFQKEQLNKKSINYGSTSKPNNRASYAKRVLAVTSGKGGVGKSTISANLAVALAQEGFRVGILDADVYGPNIPRILGVAHEKLQWSEDKIIPSENFGVKIMSVALTTPKADTPLVWRSSVAVSALIQFLEDVAWGELDFLVIDMPPGTGDVQLTMAQELNLDMAILVTTPQLVSTDDVSRAIMMFKDIGVKIGGIIENMSYFIAPDTKKEYDIFGKGGGEVIAKKYNIPFLGAIPLDIAIREHSDSGRAIVALGEDFQKSYYKQIVENII